MTMSKKVLTSIKEQANLKYEYFAYFTHLRNKWFDKRVHFFFFFFAHLGSARGSQNRSSESVELFPDKFQVCLGQLPPPPSMVPSLSRILVLSPEQELAT